MTPVTRNFTIVTNDTFSGSVTLIDTATQTPIDLTGATVRMDVKADYAAATPVALSFAAGSGLTLDEPAGKVSFSKTMSIPPAEYVYDLQVTFPGSIVRTYLRGRIKVLEEATA